jgi:predicted dehydrogenase
MAPKTEPKRDFRIALVGCGRISDRHFDAIHGTEGLKLVGVSDEIADRARAAGERWSVPSFPS